MLKKHILMIEPDKVLADTYEKALGSICNSVQVVATAQDGIQAADEHCPDLVICELQLVNHGGIEFIYEFRSYKDWQNIPLIIFSSVPPTEFADSQNLMLDQLAVSRYLYKPNTTNLQLIKVVDELLA